MNRSRWYSGILLFISLFIGAGTAIGDPCGMVPPIYLGEGSPITRIGVQKTYVFHHKGVESFVIRPGFRGKVDNFGMLIPFPSPPAIRKVPDEIFSHIAAAIDPPEVLIDLRWRREYRFSMEMPSNSSVLADESLSVVDRDKVVVLREEAVGMYEVAVLQAGSASALKKWMDEHGFQYPDGMDGVCEEYVQDRWCFVAVKTRVGVKSQANPKPGMRDVDPSMPATAGFDGHVQAMEFRFRSPELVVPMRLSTFNEGELRNIVYLLTDRPMRINHIPEEYVVRQVSGWELHHNLTQLLPVRILGGVPGQLTADLLKQYENARNPVPRNGLARDLFAAEILAARTGVLAHPHEEEEKELLEIGERLNLRGPLLDVMYREALKEKREEIVNRALAGLNGMTMTVIDGDFPREVLARENLTFAPYHMAHSKNNRRNYDAMSQGSLAPTDGFRLPPFLENGGGAELILAFLVFLCALAIVEGLRSRKKSGPIAAMALAGFALTGSAYEYIDQLGDPWKRDAALEKLVAMGERAVGPLAGTIYEDDHLIRRGFAVVALAQIPSNAAAKKLTEIQKRGLPQVVRTWVIAARIQKATTMQELIQVLDSGGRHPVFNRPAEMKLKELLTEESSSENAEQLLSLASKYPQLQPALVRAILGQGPEVLIDIMAGSRDQNIRRMAAAYLATMDQRGEDVAGLVLDRYGFKKYAKALPWDGGPLFVPGITWEKEDAKILARNLLAWYLWCEEGEVRHLQDPIHNNLRSLNLARAAAYKSPGWQKVGVERWLEIWGEAYGVGEVEDLLKEQDLLRVRRYQQVLRKLKKE